MDILFYSIVFSLLFTLNFKAGIELRKLYYNIKRTELEYLFRKKSNKE